VIASLARRLGPPLLLLALAFRSLPAQDSTRATAQDSAIRVFVDCPGFSSGCDFDFFRTEITFVNYVRNREDADVHVLITTLPTGGGGSAYTITFIGLRRFAGTADTLQYFSGQTDTQDDNRKALVRVLKLGLMRFVATTPLASKIDISYTAPTGAAAGQVHDPWNYWVFSARLGIDLNGQKSQRFTDLNGSLEANRTTEMWKLSFSLSEGYNESRFDDVPITDSLGNQIGTETILSIARNYNANGFVARSLGSHWSGGARAAVSHSTFSNEQRTLSGGPALEYDFFPYADATRRRLTLEYDLAVRDVRYADTTIYDKTRETLFQESLGLSLNVTQPWGTSSASLTGSHYFHDFSKNRLVLAGGLDLRIIRGLSLNLFGDVDLIHDQLSLAKAGADESQVLLQRRELATSYRYFTFISLSYTFGSTFNNVVNPRFNGGGGTFFFSSN